MAKKPISITLKEENLERVDASAIKENRDRSAQINTLLEEAFDARDNPNRRPTK